MTYEPVFKRAEKYPEIKNLMGHDPNFKYVVLGMMSIQFLMFWLLQEASWPILLFCAYFLGGVVNHSLSLAIHEIAHNLAFGHSRPLANRVFGLVANLPIGIPISISFKKYHLEHHRYQGIDVLDTDIPSQLEATLFCHTSTKVLWVFLQPLFYALRPFFTNPKNPSWWEAANLVLQLLFDLLVARICGPRIVAYMVIGTLMAMGLHPVAGHFISEHYMFKKGFETYSYYGSLNWITFNVGYHMEHHDFPSVPGSRLPEVKRIAGEYYDHLPHHNSWTRVLYDFITDPDIGPYARIKRQNRCSEISKAG